MPHNNRGLGQLGVVAGRDLFDVGGCEVQLAARRVHMPTGTENLDTAGELGGVDVRHAASLAELAAGSSLSRITREGGDWPRRPLMPFNGL